ncbi:hypothetical protein BDD12DRAFT_984601 [Trichophaea hybrida]|nr:hypothetical protein BDD12DRAFT_984601 [Trichophaea hybrida]
MPGLPITRSSRTGRVVKLAQKARKNKATNVKACSDDEYEPSVEGDKDETETVASQSLEIFEKKVKELKESAVSNPKQYGDKFSHQTKAQEQNVINSLKKQKESIIKSSNHSDKTLSSLFEAAIGSSSSDVNSLVEHHPLAIYGASLMDTVQNFINIHKPIQNEIRSSLCHDLAVGEQWGCDGQEAMEILCKLKDESKKDMDKALMEEKKLNGKQVSSKIQQQQQQESWAEAVKNSGKGMRRALRRAAIPEEIDCEVDGMFHG